MRIIWVRKKNINNQMVQMAIVQVAVEVRKADKQELRIHRV